jgi:hypothetical protein
MSDRSDRHPGHEHADVCRQPGPPERRRVASALALADRHSVRELYFLELAVRAPDEESANALELYAYEAYKDALAIKEEHGLER